MDRHARQSRLRFLLVELIEQLRPDAFDANEWKETCQLYQEINQFCDSVATANKHYLQVRDSDYEKAAHNPAQQPSATSRNRSHKKCKNPEKTLVFRGLSKLPAGPQGFEP